MKGASWKAALLGAATAMVTLATPAAADEGLSLRRVLLSSGGVGYFEYEARVEGDAELTLPVRLDQVDDVLKSIVVYDEQGGAGTVTLPGKSAAGEAFRDLPFDPSALGSEAALLDALRGAEVVVTTAEGSREGRILAIAPETTQLPDHGGAVLRHRLSLAADGAVTTVIVETAESVRFVDPALRAQLDAALAALLGQHDRGRRTLTVHAPGHDSRVVRVGYVVSVPLWKSTYRLTLPTEPGDGTATLTGLAVVENQSGADFVDVDLTLVSGNPVTFRQALYEAYYVQRPEIPVEVVGRVLPRLDTGAVAISEKHENDAAAYAAGIAGDRSIAPAPAGEMAPAAPVLAPPPAESVEDETQVVFHLTTPLTLAAGEDALVPILDRSIPAARVSLYQPDVNAVNPIASVQLRNDGDTGLPPGVVTTYERSPAGAITYLGDARLATLPAGETRMVSFGVDPKVRVDRREHDAQTVSVGTISGGVLRLTRIQRHTTDYTLTGAAHEPRTVIVEQPRLGGYELAAPRGDSVTVTPDRYRFRVEVPAGGTVPLTVTLEMPMEERVMIADLGSAALLAYATAGELPAPLRTALQHLATLRGAVDDALRVVTETQAEVARITAEQARIRDNLEVVPAGSALHQRYLTTLGEQEDRLAALGTKLTAAQHALDAARRALADALRTLSV
jgi:hypothetical protein